MRTDAEAVRVESDERGFELHIDTVEDGTLIVNIESCYEELYDAAKREIGPWLYERDQARATRPLGLSDADLEEEIRCAALGTEGPNAKSYRQAWADLCAGKAKEEA